MASETSTRRAAVISVTPSGAWLGFLDLGANRERAAGARGGLDKRRVARRASGRSRSGRPCPPRARRARQARRPGSARSWSTKSGVRRPARLTEPRAEPVVGRPRSGQPRRKGRSSALDRAGSGDRRRQRPYQSEALATSYRGGREVARGRRRSGMPKNARASAVSMTPAPRSAIT